MSEFSINVWIALFSIIGAFSLIDGFNLDVKSPLIFRSRPGDYFGYTVALHRNRKGPVALIGAPRANSSVLYDPIYQPGALYQCEIDSRSCSEIVLDKKGNTQTQHRNSDFTYHDRKDGMWLGVSLDIQQNSVRNDIVTCGHLWKNQFYKEHYLANGACYVINGELDTNNVTKLVPFVDKTKQAIIPPGIYKYAFGQVGMSATFSEDGKYLLLGAPGYYDWTGTVVSYALNPKERYQQYMHPAVPAPAGDHQTVSPESYIGYSVTSGKFYDDNLDYVAVGAPRDGGFHGRVYISKALESGEGKLLIHRKKEGVQFGEYFGAAVLGMNLNHDYFTDLLVGAPLYSSATGYDDGKVYVFISNGMGLQLFTELYGKNKPNARFGTAIANAGDLNQDGYNDVIIGAPYEDEKGVIYIYHGSRTAMNTQYVQRIAAAEIESSLSGFGIHISRGFDIDSNRYPDILVGSYASSSAVLFRAQPVIQLSAKITFSPNQINTNVTHCKYQGQNVPCVNVTACLEYSGKHVPQVLEFEHDIFVEHTSQANLVSPRGFFLSTGKLTTVIKQHSKMNIWNDYCYTDTLYIHSDIKDVITPIQLLYRYTLLGSSEKFNKSFPIMDPLSSNNITSSVTFQTGCGTDDKCLSDLSVSAVILGHTDNSSFIIGKNSRMSLSIEVVNLGEPAYLSELLIYLPPELPSINQDICSTLTADQQNQRKNASLICDLGNPLLTDKKVKILIKLDLDKMPTDKKVVEIHFEALTASTDISPQKNNLTLPLFFKAIADVSITGTPSHEQIPYDAKTEGRIPIPISHTYFAMNHGPSPVQTIDIILYIPTSFQGKGNLVDFVTFSRLEVDIGDNLLIPAECNDTYLPIKPVLPDVKKKQNGIFKNDELIPESSGNNTFLDLDYGIENGESIPARFKRSSFKKSVRKRKDIVINCETAKCIAIKCSASATPFIEARKFSKITVDFQVNLSIVNEFLDPWYRIEFVTSGEVFIREDNSGVKPVNHHPDKTVVKTIIVSSSPPASEEIAQWIIFVSIGVGIILLLIILFLLIKFGFFKREQKEKMEKMKSKADRKDYEPYEGESTESVALN